jgi:hypothetical protein
MSKDGKPVDDNETKAQATAQQHNIMQEDNAQNRLRQPLSRFGPPRWAYDQTSKEDATQAVSNFLDIAAEAVALVEYLNKESLELCKSVVKEYCDVICTPVLPLAKDTNNQSGPRNSLENSRTDLEKKICALKELVGTSFSAGHQRQTLFDVVFNALKSRYLPGPDFHNEVNKDKKVWQWLHHAQDCSLLPKAICFDIGGKIVGTSVSPWSKCKVLRNWERDIRRRTINPAVKEGYKKLRDIIRPLKKHNEEENNENKLSPEAQVSRAKQLVSNEGGVLPQSLSKNRTWQAYRFSEKEGLQFLDPCSTCRVAHTAKTLQTPKTPEDGIGIRWNDDDPCQCAEAWVTSQLQDANQHGGGGEEEDGDELQCEEIDSLVSPPSRPFAMTGNQPSTHYTVGASAVLRCCVMSAR